MSTVVPPPTPPAALPTGGAIIPKKGGALAAAAMQVRDVLAKHGIDHAALAALLADQQHLLPPSNYVFGLTEVAPSLKAMRDLVQLIEQRLDLAEPLAVDLAGPMHHALGRLRAAFATTVLGLSGWTVIGSILTSRNDLAARTSPLITLAILLTVLVALALLEAAHIGAVALSTADVSTLEYSHPRVFRLHRFIATKAKLEDYLAARQVGVVLLVFVMAEVTRTVGLSTLPGTSIAIPPALGALFQIGAPGALLVLIVGQVAPQIVTARRPAAMMNLFPMAAAFHATRFVGHLGLAQPASWLVSWSTATERIPSAPRERFTSATVDVAGFGTLMTRRDISVGSDHTRATTESTIVFHENDRTMLSLDVASVSKTPSRLRVSGCLFHEATKLPVVCSSLNEYRMPDPRGTLLACNFAPRAGCFQIGDVLDITTVADYDEQLDEDFVVITAPTKLATIRVVLEHPPAPLPPARLALSRQTDGEVYETRAVAVHINDDDGSAEFFASIRYPDPGTVIRLDWAPIPLDHPWSTRQEQGFRQPQADYRRSR